MSEQTTPSPRWSIIRDTDVFGRTPDEPKRRGRRPIATDRAPVKVLGDALSTVWWRGRQWAVTASALSAWMGAIRSKRPG
jgi:hypothetical protein